MLSVIEMLDNRVLDENLNKKTKKKNRNNKVEV